MIGRRLAIVVAVAMVSAGCGWTQFGGNAAHTRLGGIGSGVDVENVSTLTKAWTAPLSGGGHGTPAVAGGVVYVVGSVWGGESWTGTLYAFDAAGIDGCSGTPKICAPLWTSSIEHDVQQSPVVAGGVVYFGDADGTFYAFDAAGTLGCSGLPKTCAPLWTAEVAESVSDAAVSGAVVYLTAERFGVEHLYAFDALGVQGCAGIPKTCEPLWTAQAAGSVTVSGGFVNAGGQVFDAAGVNGCAGTPKTCEPLWFSPSGGPVWGGMVFSGGAAYDATGVTACWGTPKTCAPLWKTSTGARVQAVANGLAYADGASQRIEVYDAAGVEECTGAPTKTCNPLWTYPGVNQVRAVSDGVLYADGFAFDAGGIKNCWFTPKACAPLWAAPSAAVSVISNRAAYGVSNEGLHAFTPKA